MYGEPIQQHEMFGQRLQSNGYHIACVDCCFAGFLLPTEHCSAHTLGHCQCGQWYVWEMVARRHLQQKEQSHSNVRKRQCRAHHSFYKTGLHGFGIGGAYDTMYDKEDAEAFHV
jgi:hypothetical protein